MTFNVIRGQGQGEEMTSVPYWDNFFIFSLRDLFELVSSLANSSVSDMLVKCKQNYVSTLVSDV